ncbi:phosphate signaling complex protein PhoU [Sulfobacillus thermosulfidooxidans]|uniref:phosphate signaling complex protein PhoU n=1 Tax=Sulfobacillus thermosulfidooxidans TaxID=28034 RepID=UPI00096B9618|nr:phosphate signaling complex protein PhoU [Sulfobacillus thermosulfidooxidans]OLZ09213.1 phosphate transport system regulatory protein PhoU [Sulfobacillus thermosulfidooxidans]OLZ17778.1 phosphate transport system regulatory protein PhoU [Sulfobacillus thermosulfidooxidans]OLZ22324.1 phosphate transport system regulatory protein PhoU [Sulfobacillus thermosulfidooxidans]
MFVSSYDRSLEDIIRRVNHLADDVYQMLGQALNSLYQQDKEAAQRVLDHDDYVDDETNAIEEDSLQLISLQQPRQKDLRILAASLRIVRDLERIADYSCDIAEVTEILAHSPYFKPLIDIPRLGTMTLNMLKLAAQAVNNHDIALAHDVYHQDDAVDALYIHLHDELMEAMRQHRDVVEQASYLSLVARYLERIADHAVNIAEMTVFVENGDRRPFRRSPFPSGHSEEHD